MYGKWVPRVGRGVGGRVFSCATVGCDESSFYACAEYLCTSLNKFNFVTLICDSGVILGRKSDAYHFMGVKGVESQTNNVIPRFCSCRTLFLNLFMTSLRNNFKG